ncbi:MAG: 3-oxo-5-alpha-steroid 4-dehydrogenase-domain-containing protein [Piptocephalis tieghemiana]|nr:MAG: 3-oxo-5-alpha-steroid 4-dehydrogenase-domain-containing protein [Piptocephalis tieghemiana]
MQSLLPLLIKGTFLTMSSGAFVARAFPSLRPYLSDYGKVQVGRDLTGKGDRGNTLTTRQGKSVWLAFKCFMVPKYRFRDFYLLSSIWCGWMLYALVYRWCYLGQLTFPITLVKGLASRSTLSSNLSIMDAILPLTFMTIQSLRRLYEQCLIERPSAQATMHISHYMAGLFHYSLMPLAVWIHTASLFHFSSFSSPDHLDLAHLTLRHLLASILFLWASYHHHRQHTILAHLRSPSSSSPQSTPVYRIPQGDWFDLVASPHYLFECIIYVAMTLAGGGSDYMTCVLLWVFTNLGTTAHGTLEWYRAKFPHFPKERRAMIPYLW